MTAHKNSGNNSVNHWHNNAVFYLIVAMIISVFLSRAALSVTCILFVILTVVHKEIFQQLRRFLQTPLLLFFSLLFFIPFVSGLWSADLEKWSDVVRLKLPLLFFPLAFAGGWNLTTNQWKTIGWVFLALIFCGCMYGLIHYALHYSLVNESYLRAKTILTPLEDDHVRYSWLVVAGIILSLKFLQEATNKKAKITFFLLAIFFAVYLHILSARTGLFCFYLFLFLLAGWFFLKRKNWKLAFACIAAIIILPLTAYFFLPTFTARLRYNLYDLSFVQKQEYLPGSSDGARALSLQAGWQLLKENPLGVGAGDVMHEADKWYDKNVPQVLPTDKLAPNSEWLMYGGFAGWAGVSLFTIIMATPFIFRPKQGQLYWIGLAATAAFSFVFDTGLEVQFGIFLYIFLTLWWWKWFNLTSTGLAKQGLSDS